MLTVRIGAEAIGAKAAWRSSLLALNLMIHQFQLPSYRNSVRKKFSVVCFGLLKKY
jgi:hypothetical protein